MAQNGVNKLADRVEVTPGPKGRNVVLESKCGSPKIVNDGDTVAKENGVNKLADLVEVTPGPKGRNVVLESKCGSPKIVNDGDIVAKEVELEDPVENIGAKLVRQAAAKTNDLAGDGGTTSVVLAQGLIAEGVKVVAAGANPIQITRGIEKTAKAPVDELRKLSKEEQVLSVLNNLSIFFYKMDSPSYGKNLHPPRNRNFQQNSPQNFPFDLNFYPAANFYSTPRNMGNSQYFQQLPFYPSFPASQQIPPQNQPHSYQMSPGAEGSSSFHQIEDDNEENEGEADEDDVVETHPFHSSQTNSHPSSQAKKTWSTMEDEALISSFMSSSCDAVVGTKQKSGQLWKKVMATFEMARAANPDVIAKRNMDSLKGRWRRIGASVMKWVGCYDEATNRRRSGMNDEDVIQEAYHIYERTHNSKFLFHHAWALLNRYPKWQKMLRSSTMNPHRGRPKQSHHLESSPETGSSSKRSRLDESGGISSNPSTPTSGDAGMEPCIRPEGVKNAKQKGEEKVSKTAMDAVCNLGDRSQRHTEARSKEIELENKELEYQKEKLELQNKKLEYQKEKLQWSLEKKKWDMLTTLLRKTTLTPEEARIRDKLSADLGLV